MKASFLLKDNSGFNWFPVSTFIHDNFNFITYYCYFIFPFQLFAWIKEKNSNSFKRNFGNYFSIFKEPTNRNIYSMNKFLFYCYTLDMTYRRLFYSKTNKKNFNL